MTGLKFQLSFVLYRNGTNSISCHYHHHHQQQQQQQ
jgi:hypothetical protein